MKWQDTSPVWQPQSMDRLQQVLPGYERPESRPAVEPAPVSILVSSRVCTAIHAHLGQQLHEQGGLLIGEVFGDPAAQAIQVLLITESIASTEFDASAISLRMHSSIWSEARSRLTEQRLIIGWYHSHPDLGAFFSVTDRRTQAAFFSHPYSVGWVIDPVRSEQAWYLGGGSQEISLTQCAVLPD
jgi:proteasome lid subunit RPN8/RPN11